MSTSEILDELMDAGLESLTGGGAEIFDWDDRKQVVLRAFAVSRLMLDNFPHVKAFWVMHELSTSQLALNYAADDMDGSVVEYKITHDADGFGTPDKLTRDNRLDLIRDAGVAPKERNTRYEVIRTYDGPAPLDQPRAAPQAIWA